MPPRGAMTSLFHGRWRNVQVPHFPFKKTRFSITTSQHQTYTNWNHARFLCLCVCACPLQTTNGLPSLPPPRTRKAMRKRDYWEKNWRARRQLLVFGPNAILVCGPKAIFNSFLSASARRPLHMLRRKGGQTSSRFTRVSDGSFRRTLQALRDAASVLAFPFKIFVEGPSLSLRKGESAYMYGDGKQTNPGACHGEARLPASSCELLLPSFVWVH